MADDKFDIIKTTAAWKAIPVDPNEIPVQADTAIFIGAYRDLIKIFNLFGSGFSFVTSDVVKKLAILEGHLNNRDKANGNTTLQKMMDYEQAEGIIKKDPKNNGSRNLLRLVRAAQFIQLIIKYITERRDVPMSTCTWEAYEKTIASFHTFFVKKAVGVAVYAVPNRESLLTSLGVTEEEALVQLPKLVDAVGVVHASLDDYYTRHNLQELP